jgi:hypothetical protein
VNLGFLQEKKENFADFEEKGKFAYFWKNKKWNFVRK